MKGINKHGSFNLEVCITLILFILMIYQCYTYIELKPYFRWMRGLSILILIYISILGMWGGNIKRFQTEFFISINVLITFIIAVPTEGLNTIAHYVSYLTFLLPLYLILKKPSLSLLEKIMFGMAILYLLCWFSQILYVPNLLFVGDNVDIAGDDSRGFFRFYIPTKEHMPFLVFFFLSLYNKTKRIVWLLLSFVVFALVILHVMRQVIFWTLVMAIAYYLVANKRNIKRTGLFIAFASLFAYFILFDMNVFKELNSLTIESIGSNSFNSADTGNIRFKAMEHFFTSYNQDFIHFLWGNGLPGLHSGFSSQLAASVRSGYHLSDVGFIGLYVNFGFISLLLYGYLLFKILFKTQVHSNHLYLKFYIGYLVLTYLGGHALTSNLIFFVLSTYIIKSSRGHSLETIKEKAKKMVP